MMLKIENTDVYGWEAAIRGMRNPKNSWDLSDTEYADEGGYLRVPNIGEKDLKLMKALAKAGNDHGKFMRMIDVTCDIVAAPTFWWAEMDTYKIATVRNSCSKMHTIHIKPIEITDFSHEGCSEVPKAMIAMCDVVETCEWLRLKFNETQEKKYWRALIELLPEGFNLRATMHLNYAVLKNIYRARRAHKVFEWHTLCEWIEHLPYSELITET